MIIEHDGALENPSRDLLPNKPMKVSDAFGARSLSATR
jgi:hypothetical protein